MDFAEIPPSELSCAPRIISETTTIFNLLPSPRASLARLNKLGWHCRRRRRGTSFFPGRTHNLSGLPLFPTPIGQRWLRKRRKRRGLWLSEEKGWRRKKKKGPLGQKSLSFYALPSGVRVRELVALGAIPRICAEFSPPPSEK